MNRESFVKDSSVNDFIQWLSTKLDAGFIHSYTDRRTKKVWDCISVYNAYEKYQWGGEDFSGNAKILDKLSFDLKNSIENKFNPSKLHNIISCISTYYKFADFY